MFWQNLVFASLLVMSFVALLWFASRKLRETYSEVRGLEESLQADKEELETKKTELGKMKVKE